MSVPPPEPQSPEDQPLNPPPAPARSPQDEQATEYATAMLAHFLGVVMGPLGPGFIFLLARGRSRFLAFHALQALLFQIAMTSGYFLSGALTVVLIGSLLLPAFVIVSLVFGLLAGLAAYKGRWFEIPLVGQMARRQLER